MGAQYSAVTATAAPKQPCYRHSMPFLPFSCTLCSSLGAATPAASKLCVVCIREHTVAHPTHTLDSNEPDDSALRAVLAAFCSLPEATLCDRAARDTTAAATSARGPVPGAVLRVGKEPYPDGVQVSQACPLVECARRRALAPQVGLDELTANVEASLEQLDATREGLLAALQVGIVTCIDAAEVHAAFASGVEALHTAAATKRTGLEVELVAADAALVEAIDAGAALAETVFEIDGTAIDSTAIMRRASLAALFERFSAAQAAVAAVPEQPVTSSFLRVELPPTAESSRADAQPSMLLDTLTTVWVSKAAQLQAWLPPGGSSSPEAWKEVYRASTHGFAPEAFHSRCKGRPRLVVLVFTREGGWIFGGFTAVGFIPGPIRYIADPEAFLFSLTNSLGCPEKLESRRSGMDLFYEPSYSATFGRSGSDDYDFFICDRYNMEAGSHTHVGEAFAESASTGAHPMAQGHQGGWRAAEVVAWVV